MLLWGKKFLRHHIFRGILISRFFRAVSRFRDIVISWFTLNTLLRNVLTPRWYWKLNFLCEWVSSNLGILWKIEKLNTNSDTFVYSFTNCWFGIKTSKKIYFRLKIPLSSSSESKTGFTNPITLDLQCSFGVIRNFIK